MTLHSQGSTDGGHKHSNNQTHPPRHKQRRHTDDSSFHTAQTHHQQDPDSDSESMNSNQSSISYYTAPNTGTTAETYPSTPSTVHSHPSPNISSLTTTAIASLTNTTMQGNIRPLTAAEHTIIRPYFTYTNNTDRISHHTLPAIITAQSFQRLKPSAWLNNEIINGYLALLVQWQELIRSHPTNL
jgi:Ulp1 family protease